ncbi:hypothetical protein Trydic_g8011 [Trypoxylus dichotomus]
MEANIKVNPNASCPFVGSHRTTSKIPGQMFYNDEQVTQSQNMVNSFGHHLSYALTSTSHTINTNYPSLGISFVTENEVLTQERYDIG